MPALLEKLKFRARVVKRAFNVIPKRDKAVKLVDVNYLTDQDSNSTLILRYNFENALWYEFENKKTFADRQVVCRPEDGETKVRLSVHGLFNKNDYTIVLQPDKVQISGICKSLLPKERRQLYKHSEIKPRV
ncbi:hypothetical protein [Flavobacterium coralii]|uniref:hypothetical protein n=1 Tax=Flavobacterium coralii TaxID=2838017 RepID=UPI000C65896F|nr:hypothetical protein [Flavobacterium sp.]|tara:strand:+ start:71 stop:466 length:396 start_codon:yes stop_codon:yes gene_type:complete